MKHLLLVRHAKSSWANPGQADFDRQLNERGHKDAPMMAKRILDRNITIDSIITSTALRALTTAEYFAHANEIPKSKMIQHDFLYATCICSHLCDDFHRRIFYFLQISGSHFNFYRRILSERKEVD